MNSDVQAPIEKIGAILNDVKRTAKLEGYNEARKNICNSISALLSDTLISIQDQFNISDSSEKSKKIVLDFINDSLIN